MSNTKTKSKFSFLILLILSLCLSAFLFIGHPVTANAAEGELTVTEAVDSDSDGYFEIDSAAKLWWFTQQVNGGNNSLNAELTANIDLSGTCGDGIGNWLPISHSDGYNGHFNGQGYTVMNLYIESDEQYAGLFGYVKGATIENVTVTGSVSSTFYSIYDENYNFYDGAAGGVVAHLDGGTIRNCESTVTVTGGYYFGGICGQMLSGNIADCINRGTIICFQDSTNQVEYGGIVGFLSDGTVRGCINHGEVTVGTRQNYVINIGGIVGRSSYGTIENCINMSSIVGSNTSTGGIVGKNWVYATVRNCGNLGTVTGDYAAGGITGVNEGIIEHCWDIASVSGTSEYVGPIAGYISTNYGNITNNYYLSDTETDDGGRTAEQFASGQVTYELNGSTTTDESVWKQTLGTDSYPALTGENVYYVTSKKCNETVIENLYSNSSEDIIVHEDTDNNSFCDLCKWLIITEIAFPDANFRNIILSAEFDLDQDGLLSTEEIASVTILYLEGRGFTDITGINYFTELTELDAQNNNFTSLNLSGLTKLESLYLNANPNLESLNLTGCTALRSLYLISCIDLATLNIQDCVALQYLDLSSCSKLANSLKVGHLTELIYLNVDGIWLRELDLSNNTKLEDLYINDTGLTTLDLSNNPNMWAIYGMSEIPTEHCGVGYVNLNEFVDDISKILSVTNGTLDDDGWVKLDDGATYLFYYYDTGLEGYPLSVEVHLSISNVEHSYVSNITGKDETGHFTEWCETCRTGNEESVTEHTYEEIVQADFAKTPATCTTGTIYYKSCECGRTIEETFEDTDLNSENHTGTNDKLVPNGVLHHDVVWSCCGAVVTENVDCTASNADGSCLTAETCACGNLLIAAKDSHKLTYTASGNVITETCGRDGCAHTATATLHAPENPVYNGTQKLATVTYSDDWKGDDLMVGYSGTANDGSSYAGIVYPAVKAGTVTASITAQSDDYTVATANVTYTIQKAPVTVGIVSVESPEAIYPHTALGSIVLTRTNTTIPGTLALNAGQTLTVGTREYNWTWTPDDTNNYKETKGTITIAVTKATPTADIFDFTSPENLVCDGLAKEATVTVQEAIEGVGSVTVKYFKDGVELDGAPTTVGTYTVKIEVAEGANFFKSEELLTDEAWTFTFDITDEATHTGLTLKSNENGTHDKYCTVCQKVFADDASCVYEETVNDAYVASPATCISGTTYYKSCECGHKSVETFVYGDTDPDNHDWNDTDVCSRCNAVKISEKTFPDANFRHFISGEFFSPLNDDGVFTSEELAMVKSVRCTYDDGLISDLTGIEYFTEATELHVGLGRLTSVDLSKNTKLTDVTFGVQVWEITINPDATFDLNTLGIDVSLLTLPEGYTVNDGVIKFEASVYDVSGLTYPSGYGDTLFSVTLTVTNPHTHASVEAFDNCTKQEVCLCGEITKAAKEHDFSGEYLSDADGHWHKCENCDVIDTKGDHTGGTATCTAQAVCTVCGTSYGSTIAHNYSVPQKDGADHWNKCSDCTAIDTKEAHNGTATCTAKAHCSVCDTDHGELDANNHSKTTFIYTANADGTTHTKKYECCGVVALDSEAHTYGTDDKCICGAEKPIPTYTVTVENGTASDGNTSIVVNENGFVTVTANAAPEGKKFKGWSVNGKIVSAAQSYTFNATADTTITAVYEDIPKNSGCGSVIGIGSSVIVVALIGLAVIFIRKKRLI